MKFAKVAVSGIYRIRNLSNGKVYVGASRNVEKRWQAHRSFLNSGRHPNGRLQDDWNANGSRHFAFELIQEAESAALSELEEFFIRESNSTDQKRGYNTLFGPHRTGVAHTAATKIRIGVAHRGLRKPTSGAKIAKANRQRNAVASLKNWLQETGLSSPNQKLSPDALTQLAGLKADGFSHLEIAALFGVNKSTISRALAGSTHRKI